MIKVQLVDGQGNGYAAKVNETGQLVSGPLEYSEPYAVTMDSVNTAYVIATPLIRFRFVITGILLDAGKDVSASTAGTIVLYETDAEDSIVETKEILTFEMLKNTSRVITGLNVIVTEGEWLSIRTTDATVYATVLGYYVEFDKEPILSTGGGSSSIPVASPLLTDLYAWYDLEEDSGTRVDALGNWDLTSQNGTPDNDTGLIGSALNLNSTGTAESIYGALSTGLGFDGDGDFTISLWVKFDAGGTFETYVSHWGGNGSKSWFFSKDASDNIRVDSSSNGTGITTTTTHGSITATNWNHLVFVYDDTAGEIRVYVNNSLDATTHSSSLAVVANYFVIWGTLGTNSNAMNGNIDLVGCWNRKLDNTEVSLLYNSGAGTTYPF